VRQAAGPMDRKLCKVAVICSAAGLVCLLRRSLILLRRKQKDELPTSGSALLDFIRLIKAKNIGNFLAQRQQVLGDAFQISIPPLFPKTVVVMNIDSVHSITALESKKEMSIRMPPAYEALHGQDLQLTRGDAHKLWRRILNPVISPRALESYLPKLLGAFEGMWQHLAGCGTQFVIQDKVKGATLRVMADLLYGVQFSDDCAFDQLKRDFEAEEAGLFAPAIRLPGTTFSKALDAAKRIRAFLKDLLNKEVKQHSTPGDAAKASPNSQRPLRSAIQAIVELHMSPDEEVRASVANEELVLNNLLLLLEASQGTTMYATTALLAELHRQGHEDHLARAQAEVLTLIGGKDNVRNWDKDRVSLKMMEDMQFCNACINEILRLYPFAGAIPKILPAGQTLDVLGKTIHGPIDVMLCFGHAFTDPAVFPKPLDFLPDRWLPNASPSIAVSEAARRSFMPFGLGPHVCLGQALARLSMKANVVSLFASGHTMNIIGPLERVPDILPSWRIANGGIAQVVEQDSAVCSSKMLGADCTGRTVCA